MKINVTFSLDYDVLDLIDKISWQRGIARARIIEEFLVSEYNRQTGVKDDKSDKIGVEEIQKESCPGEGSGTS